MSDTAKTDAAELRYLLGDLSEEERTRMEGAFFADDSKFEALAIAEDELIDAYIRNELSPEEQYQFKSNLLKSPRIRERVNFARALANKANSDLPLQAEASTEPAAFRSPANKRGVRRWSFFAQRPSWGMAMTSCAILILVPSVVLISGWLRLRNESEQLASDRSALQQERVALDKLSAEQRTSTEQYQAELKQEKERLAEERKNFEESRQAQTREPGVSSILGMVSSVLLRPGIVRSDGAPQRLRLRPETSTAQLKLALESNDYRSYAVTIETPAGEVLHSENSLPPRKSKLGPLVMLSIPSQRLPPGDYVVEIKGRTATGQIDQLHGYAFRVVAEK